MHSITRVLLVGLALLAGAGAVEAQSVADRLKAKAKERAAQRTDQALDRAVDRAEQAVECVATDRTCIQKAEESGQAVRVTDGSGKVVEERPATAAASTPSATPSATASGAPAADTTLRPGEGAWSNYDFVPGERVLFAEDFTADRVGNFPRRLELIEGNMEVVEWQRPALAAGHFGAPARSSCPSPRRFPSASPSSSTSRSRWVTMGFYSADRETLRGSQPLRAERDRPALGHRSGVLPRRRRRQVGRGPA